MKKQPTFFQLLENELLKKKKALKKKKFLFQTRVFLTLVLPFVITVLLLQVIHTWLRIQIRKTAGTVPTPCSSDSDDPQTCNSKSSQPQEISLESFRPEFITPEPIDTAQ